MYAKQARATNIVEKFDIYFLVYLCAIRNVCFTSYRLIQVGLQRTKPKQTLTRAGSSQLVYACSHSISWCHSRLDDNCQP